MDWTFLRAGAGIVIAVGLVSSAYAAATDYAFEAVKGEIKKGRRSGGSSPLGAQVDR